MSGRPDAEQVQQQLQNLAADTNNYASDFVDILLHGAGRMAASDIHIQPTAEGLEIRWRFDGVLHRLGLFPRGKSTDIVSRLKVLAELLTYRNDIPQEGRIREPQAEVEIRVSTFPTLHGERAVIRMFAAEGNLLYMEDLGLPDGILGPLHKRLAETSGAIIVSGPAGSGKTTTAYACLRELVRKSGGTKSIVSLEDPIEVAVEGVAQSQVNPTAGFDLAAGLRSLMRQDPEAIMVGEIRDRATAEVVFQAALTGHLVITTFHAGSASGAISRLSDMGIEPYLLRSGILGILSQRLVRSLCQCARPATDEQSKLGLPVARAKLAVGCHKCFQTGYYGRSVLAELLVAQPTELGRAILSRSDAPRLQERAIESGMVTVWQRACEAVDQGITSPDEVRRVLGFLNDPAELEPDRPSGGTDLGQP
jgi:type II secretory ATPase GspE/PulE/Tfp pilus assembly ATPase PilB-like protein